MCPGTDNTTETLFKVIIIGDPTVGKTSFTQRYVWNYYPRNYKMTIGVDYAVKVVKRSDNSTIKLQLWDIAGQERFARVTRVYYKNAHACIIMFDLTNRESFASVVRWKTDLDSKCTLADGNPVPCILLANKCDLENLRQVPTAEVETMSKDLMFVGWSETSAKECFRIEQSMEYLVDEMLKRHNVLHLDDDDEDEEHSHGNITLQRKLDDDEDSKCKC